MTHIANQCATRNSQGNNPVVIIRGPHRYIGDVAALHSLAMQGWFLIRTSAGVQAHHADVSEGTA